MRAPKKFRIVRNIIRAEFTATRPAFIRDVKLKGKFKRGIEYEGKAFEFLRQEFGKQFSNCPWIVFEDEKGKSVCQPDGLLLLEDRTIIVEVKLKHCARAWWQLHKLYLPLVQHLFPDKPVYLAEMTTQVDPATPFPGITTIRRDLRNCLPQPYTNLYIWRPW